MHEVYSLIKSMDGAEKRYFRLYSGLHTGGNNKYIKLFDLIESGSAIEGLSKSQLPNLRNYLTRQILSALRLYKNSHSIDIVLREILDEIEILYDRKLYKSCYKRIRKLKKLAKDNERYLYLAAALRWEDMTDKFILNIKKIEEKINNSYSEELDAVNQYGNQVKYTNLISRLLLLEYKQGYERNPETTRQMEELLNSPLMKADERNLPERIRLMINQVKCTYYYSKENYPETGKYLQKIIGLIEQQKFLSANQMTGYLTQLKNQLIIFSYLKDEDRFFNTLEKMRGLPEKHPNISRKELDKMIYEASISEEINYYMLSGKMKEALSKTEYAETGLKKYAGKLLKINELSILYNLASVYHYNGRFDESIDRINKILNYPDTTISENIFCFTRLLFLMVNYDMGNYDLVESRIKSTGRFLNKRNKLYKFESLILRSIRKLLNAAGRANELRILNGIKNDIEFISGEPFEKRAADDLEIAAWINSKIKRSPFIDEIKLYKEEQQKQ